MGALVKESDLEAAGRLSKQKALVKIWQGDISHAASVLDVSKEKVQKWIDSDWFREKIYLRQVSETSQDRRARSLALAEEVCNRLEVQVYWSNLMNDESAKMADRLKASELLAKSHGMFIERHEVTTVEAPQAREVDVNERLRLISAGQVKIAEAEVVKEESWLG